MDVSVITGAIAAGAVVAAKDIATTAVKDAYSGLKALIKQWFEKKGDTKGDMVLAEYESDPVTWEKPLSKALVETGCDEESDILAAVTLLLESLKETPGGTAILAKYNLQNCEIGVVGDHAVIHGDIHVGSKK